MENPKGQFVQANMNHRHRSILMKLYPPKTKSNAFRNAFYRGAQAHLEGDHDNPYTAKASRLCWQQGHDAAQKCVG